MNCDCHKFVSLLNLMSFSAMELITLIFYHFSCQPDLTNKQEVMTILFQTILPAFLWGWDGKNCHLLISFDASELDSCMTPFEIIRLVHNTIHNVLL